MRILRPLALVLIAIVARPAFPQDAAKRLTNQDIIEMTSLNLSDDVIIAKIRSATGADASKTTPPSTASKPSKLPTFPTPSSK